MFKQKKFKIGSFTFFLESHRDKQGKEWVHFFLPPEQAAVFAENITGKEKPEDDPHSIIELVRQKVTDRKLGDRYLVDNKHPSFRYIMPENLTPGIWVSFNEGEVRKFFSRIPLIGGLFKRNIDEISRYIENIGIPSAIGIVNYWKSRGNDESPAINSSPEVPPLEAAKNFARAIQTEESDYLASISNDVLRIIDGNIYKPSDSKKPFIMRLNQGKNRQDLALEVGQFLVQTIQNDFRTMTSEEINPIYKQINDVFEKTFSKEGAVNKGASVADIGIEAGLIYERIVWPERALDREKQPDKAFLIR